MRKPGIVAALCATVALGGWTTVNAAAQQPPPTGQPPTGQSSPPPTMIPPQNGVPDANAPREAAKTDTQKFVEKAAIANMAEIQLGQLAETRAQSPEVKEFAQMMVTDHTKALDELKQAAGGATIPSALDKKHQKLHDKLSKLSGAEFDKKYMEAMVDGHKDVAKMLKKQSEASHESASAASPNGSTVGTSGSGSTSGTTGTSGEVEAGAAGLNQWATSTLPAVESHLDKARQIEDSLKSASKPPTAMPEQPGTTTAPPTDTPSTPPTTPPSGGDSAQPPQ
jgi:putative membrane protein